jgi:hypothetical protein
MFPPVLQAITLFQQKIVVFDAAYTDVDGRAVQTPGINYNILGVIQSASPEQIEYLAEGERTDAAKLIHTRIKLKISGTGQTSQSYVRYDGDVWRVFSLGDWSGKFYRYICPKVNRRSAINA